MIDSDLAALYGVSTRVLNQAVKRNRERFPADFVFQLNAAEREEVITNCDHLRKLKCSSTLPYAFTEHGALMASAVLSSQRAVDVSLYVVRAFEAVFDAIRELMRPPEPTRKQRIGFVQED